jgi:hypothetical protein
MERFDKGKDYTAFWDNVYGDDGFSESDIEQIQAHISQFPLDNPRPEIIGDFDDDLPF